MTEPTRNQLVPPIREVWQSSIWRCPDEMFDETSAYFEALKSTRAQLNKHSSFISEIEWANFRTLLVHECEMAKLWRGLWESKDDPQSALHDWISISRKRMDQLYLFLDNIDIADKPLSYDIRHAFYLSSQIAISLDETRSSLMPDPNLECGGLEIPTGGPVAQAIELQFAARLFLGRFDQWIGELRTQIQRLHEGFRIGRRIGPVFIDPPLTDREIDRRDSLQLAIFALVARLRKAFAYAFGPQLQLPNHDMLAGDFPEGRIYGWGIIHQFVQASFPDETEALDLNPLKQRWSSMTKNRKLRLTSWPQAVHRQA